MPRAISAKRGRQLSVQLASGALTSALHEFAAEEKPEGPPEVAPPRLVA